MKSGRETCSAKRGWAEYIGKEGKDKDKSVQQFWKT